MRTFTQKPSAAEKTAPAKTRVNQPSLAFGKTPAVDLNTGGHATTGTRSTQVSPPVRSREANSFDAFSVVDQVMRLPDHQLELLPVMRSMQDGQESVYRSCVSAGNSVAKHVTDKPAFQRHEGKAENHTGMPTPLKAGLEALSGLDLSGVRVHTHSSKPAQFNALAYTQGQDIHLGPGHEKHLPHEAWHAVQQMQGRVRPTMQAKGVSISDDAQLEREADVMGATALQMRGAEQTTSSYANQRALSLPQHAAPLQLFAEPNVKKGGGTWTVTKGDRLWKISKEVYGHIRYIAQITAANPGKHMVVGEIYSLPEIEVPMGTALHDQKTDDVGLRDLAVSISDADYDTYISGLSQEEHAKDAEFLQLVDMMRSSGMTMGEMVDDQKTSMEGKAKADGKSIGELIAGDVAKRGYGGGKATEWSKLTRTEKADYAKRFKVIVKELETNSPESVMSTIKEAKSHGGRFIWEPEEVEKSNAFAYTAEDWSLHAGQHFVDAVEKDPSIAYANITHEMGGHNEYGSEKGFQIINAVLDDLPAAERRKATAGGNSVYSAYGYMETELWAELREDEFDSDKNPTDRPFVTKKKGNLVREPDVKHQLEVIKETFSPAVAEALVRSLYKRALKDNRITPDAFSKFLEDIIAVFGIKL